ncbi:MAG: DUF3500 domain-containing protein [Bryobacteraceae bacterium]
MRHIFVRVAMGSVCVIALAATYQRTRSSEAMAQAAGNFLAILPADAQAKATYAFDDKERLNWHFIPRERKGLPLREMDAGQRALAMGLLSTGLSPAGFKKVGNVLSLEPVLRDQEKDTKGRRDAAGYFFTVFGKPSSADNWGWRFEGHHVALNYNVIKGRAVATSPSFFGANPAEIKDGPRKGFRALAAEEDRARELLKSLDAKQKPLALLSAEAPKDIQTMANVKVAGIDPKGIGASKLSKKQQELLMGLIEEYAANMPEDLAAARMDGVRKAGVDKIHFAWLGGEEHGQPHYYRVQGPSFLIEYDNTQNNANHVHSVWRDFNGDFGADLLTAHYQQFHLARR